MRCESYRNKFLDYLEGELTQQERQEVEAHLAHCLSCQEEVRGLQETLGLIANFPVPEPPEAFWQGYLRELREKAGIGVGRPRPLEWLTLSPWRPVPAFAIGVLLMVAAFITWNTIARVPTELHLPSLVLTQDLAMIQDLDLLREMDLVETLDLLDSWDLIRQRMIEGAPKGA